MNDKSWAECDETAVVFWRRLFDALSVFATSLPYVAHLAATVDRWQSAVCCGILSPPFTWRNWTAVRCPLICVRWEHRTAPITAAVVIRTSNNRWVPFMTTYALPVPGVGQGYLQIAALLLPQERSDVQGCIKVKFAACRSWRCMRQWIYNSSFPSPLNGDQPLPPHCVHHLFSALYSLTLQCSNGETWGEETTWKTQA
jgi:hypothetical protein